MKKLIFILFLSQSAFATGNIACFYFASQGVWQALPGYGTLGTGSEKVLQAFSIGHQEGTGGHAICSRSVADGNSSTQILEQAHYIGEADGLGPDAATCNYQSSKPYQTISRFKVTVFPGMFSKIEGLNSKLIHYVPTSSELNNWLHSSNDSLENALMEKCLDLLPGSIPYKPDGKIRDWNLNSAKN